MTNWGNWANGVLKGIGAPVTLVNLRSLYTWGYKESGANLMRWNNPLNTTQPFSGAINMNSVGVKEYKTVSDGIVATVDTLLNGRYGKIVNHLRQSVPHHNWADACDQLGVWGTGCDWLGWNSEPTREDLMTATDYYDNKAKEGDTVDIEYMKRIDGIKGAIETQIFPQLQHLQQQMDGVLGAINTELRPAIVELQKKDG